jgi:ABC-type Zn2+ transport system substrate-binding protein/surface adhesin
LTQSTLPPILLINGNNNTFDGKSIPNLNKEHSVNLSDIERIDTLEPKEERKEGTKEVTKEDVKEEKKSQGIWDSIFDTANLIVKKSL